jgi:hypothetical protein
MSKEKLLGMTPCKKHSGYYSILTSDRVIFCKKCKEEYERFAKEKTEELQGYVNEKFRAIFKMLEDTE